MQIESVVNSTINQRIQQLIQALDKKPNSFADSIDKTATAIYTIINGRNKPGYDILEAILVKYPQINPGWLLTGAGEIFKVEPVAKQSDSYLQEHLHTLEENFIRLASQLESKDKQIENKDRQIEGLQRTVDALVSRPVAPAGNFPKPATSAGKILPMPVLRKNYAAEA